MIESDADEQLLLTIVFNGKVKLHSLEVKAPSDGRAPSELQLFSNPPPGFDFDSAESAQPDQLLALSEEQLGKRIELRFVKFQSVEKIVIFIPGNKGDLENTAISSLKLWGAS
eukprot:2701190-Pleurochrysis_carterae.AAC.1